MSETTCEKPKWTVQSLATAWHGYEDWQTFAVRDEHNICLAVVGDVDRATSGQNKANAYLFAASKDLLEACKAVLTRQDWPVGTIKLKKQLEAAVERATI